jgi:hypothetical protein
MQLQRCAQLYLNRNYCDKNRLTHISAAVRGACSYIFTKKVGIRRLVYCRLRKTDAASFASAEATRSPEIVIDAVVQQVGWKNATSCLSNGPPDRVSLSQMLSNNRIYTYQNQT